MKFKAADVALAIAAGLIVVLLFRAIEHVLDLSVNDFVIAVLSTAAVLLVLRRRGAGRS